MHYTELRENHDKTFQDYFNSFSFNYVTTIMKEISSFTAVLFHLSFYIQTFLPICIGFTLDEVACFSRMLY